MPILVYLIAVIVIFAAGFGSGHTVGVNSQKVEDQVQFDRINSELSANKAEVAQILARENAKNIALAEAHDQIKSTLEKEREANRTVTTGLERKYSGLSLRFRAAKTAGSGASNSGSGQAQNDPVSTPAATTIQLPDEIAESLRQLARDADDLNDDYAKCYNGNERLSGN